MTEEQYEKGANLFQQIKSLRFTIEEFEKMQNRSVVHLDIHYPYFIDDAIQTDMKNIENEWSIKIVGEAMECLRQHLIRLQHDLDQV